MGGFKGGVEAEDNADDKGDVEGSKDDLEVDVRWEWSEGGDKESENIA